MSGEQEQDTGTTADENTAAIKEGLSFDDDPVRSDEPEAETPSPEPVAAEPEAEPEPAAEPAPEPEVDTEAVDLEVRRQKVREKYNLDTNAPVALLDAYINADRKIGEQGKELGELRLQKERAEGKAEGLQEATRTPETPAKDSETERREKQAARQRANEQYLAQSFVKQGYSEEDARTMARDAITVTSREAEAIVEEKLESTGITAEREYQGKVNALLDVGAELKDERDADGNPVREDWDEVVNSPEFAEVLGTDEGPAWVDKFYTLDPQGRLTRHGVLTAYMQAREKYNARVAVEKKKAEAEQQVEDDKLRAGAVPAGGSTKVGQDVDDPEGELLAARNALPAAITGKF